MTDEEAAAVSTPTPPNEDKFTGTNGDRLTKRSRRSGTTHDTEVSSRQHHENNQLIVVARRESCGEVARR
jgi:hypothetical protein